MTGVEDLDSIADAVMAVAGLVDRAGGDEFEASWSCPHVEADPDGVDADHNCLGVRWTMSAVWGDHTARASDPLPWRAADRLAALVLTNGLCRCGLRSGTTPAKGVCLWKRAGGVWSSSCDAEPIPGTRRGDLGQLRNDWNRERRRRLGR